MLCFCYRCKFYVANICLARGIYPSRCHCVASYPLPGCHRPTWAVPSKVYIYINPDYPRYKTSGTIVR